MIRRLATLAAPLALSVCALACGDTVEDPDAGPQRAASGGATASDDAASGAGGADTAPNDAGSEPPPYCVAPCLWRAVKACTPPAAAVCHHVETQGSGDIPSETTCYSASGWFHRRTDASSAGVTDSFGHDGKVCFTLTHGGKAPGGMYYATDGLFTVGTFSPTTALCSGTPPETLTLEPTRPECAPWVGPDVPPLMPLFTCSATEAGSCPEP